MGWRTEAGGMGTTGMMASPAVPLETAIHQNMSGEGGLNPYLRSTVNVTGYNIKATDGEIGEAVDFIVDDSTWQLAFMVVDTGNWFPGKKVIISPKWIKDIEWDTSEIMVNVSVEQVKNSPEYDATKYMSDDYEANLQNYYGHFNSHKQ